MSIRSFKAKKAVYGFKTRISAEEFIKLGKLLEVTTRYQDSFFVIDSNMGNCDLTIYCNSEITKTVITETIKELGLD